MKDLDWEALFAEHGRALFSLLAYRTGDRGAAEDLLADTFERALRARRRFDRRRGEEGAWLYAIALNVARDHGRRRDAERRALERHASGFDGTGDLQHVEDRALVAEALDALDEDERNAVALRFGAGLTVPEIAVVLGCSLTTAEGRVYRALRKMRARLET